MSQKLIRVLEYSRITNQDKGYDINEHFKKFFIDDKKPSRPFEGNKNLIKTEVYLTYYGFLKVLLIISQLEYVIM